MFLFKCNCVLFPSFLSWGRYSDTCQLRRRGSRWSLLTKCLLRIFQTVDSEDCLLYVVARSLCSSLLRLPPLRYSVYFVCHQNLFVRNLFKIQDRILFKWVYLEHVPLQQTIKYLAALALNLSVLGFLRLLVYQLYDLSYLRFLLNHFSVLEFFCMTSFSWHCRHNIFLMHWCHFARESC